MAAVKTAFMEMREEEANENRFGGKDVANHETGLSLELQDWKSLNKASIKEKVDAVITTIHDGWVDPVEALIFAKKGIEMFTALEKNVRELAEAKGVGKDGLEKFSVKVSEAMVGVKYDYSACNDKDWEYLTWKAEAAKNDVKEREKFLQGITKPIELVDTNTGETNTVTPPIKAGKLGLKCEMK